MTKIWPVRTILTHTHARACVSTRTRTHARTHTRMHTHINRKTQKWSISIIVACLYNFYKFSCSFALALTIFEILTFEIYDLEKVGHGHEYDTGNIVARLQCRSQIAMSQPDCNVPARLQCRSQIAMSQPDCNVAARLRCRRIAMLQEDCKCQNL